jgi:hypothetical protein
MILSHDDDAGSFLVVMNVFPFRIDPTMCIWADHHIMPVCQICWTIARRTLIQNFFKPTYIYRDETRYSRWIINIKKAIVNSRYKT